MMKAALEPNLGRKCFKQLPSCLLSPGAVFTEEYCVADDLLEKFKFLL